MPGLNLARPEVTAAQAFDRRLDRNSATPLAVAVSGGGDSLALLLLASQWAAKAGRRLIVLTVDHGLQPASPRWARFVSDRALALGAPCQALRWEGAKPATGLPAAARMARHRLLADAARAAGARVILLGHTVDDIAETMAMRDAGASVTAPGEWGLSPAWPQGRGVFLLRPLLSVRRATLRCWLAAAAETWIEDPANDDPASARARVRRYLADHPRSIAQLCAEPPPAVPASVQKGAGGELTVSRAALSASPDFAAKLVARACVCAAGTSRPPRSEGAARLARRIAEGERFFATLAGARIEADGEAARFCREPGELRRNPLLPTMLPVGESVFDGRFAIVARAAGLTLRPLAGVTANLPASEREGLRAFSPAVRATLPAVVSADGRLSCPILAQQGAVSARPLSGARLDAALGAFPNEAALRVVAECASGS